METYKVENKRLKYTLPIETSCFLNITRGISAQVVLIGHALSRFNIYPKIDSKKPFFMQNFGVLVFFILSGFLISFTVRKKAASNPDYDFGNFFFDRFVRIFSGYIPAILFVLIMDRIIMGIDSNGYVFYEVYNFKTLIGNLFMLQDFPNWNILPLNISSFGSARPFWTIAIEWWFYMFFGWMFFYNKIKLSAATKLLILLFLSWVPFNNIIGGRGNSLTFIWYLGVLISYIFNADLFKNLNNKYLAGSVIFLLGAVFFLLWFNSFVIYDLRIGVLTAAIFLLLNEYSYRTSFFRKGSVIRVGTIFSDFSFTLYLIHYTLIELIFVLFKNRYPAVDFIISIIICNVVAFSLAYYTEFRHKRLRNFVFAKLKI